ncbi:Chitinase 1 [Rhizoclosmatium hyalinum]|nr:Chitinase 1 [Rhizoclosmatium hyalinum]
MTQTYIHGDISASLKPQQNNQTAFGLEPVGRSKRKHPKMPSFLTATAAKDDTAAAVLGIDEKPQIKPKARRWVIPVAVVIILLAVGGGLAGYFLSRSSGSGNNNDVNSSSSNSGEASGTDAGSDPGAGSVAVPTASSTPIPPPNLLPGSKRLFGYWGQNAIGNGVGITGVGTRVVNTTDYQKSLAFYCDQGYYQVMNLAFLSDFGGGAGNWGLDFASRGSFYMRNGLALSSNNLPVDPAPFLAIGKDIQHCQSLGIKIILSVGGDKSSPYDLIRGDGVLYGKVLYDTFLGGNGKVRPFGSAILDGIELDIEKTRPGYSDEMVAMLKTIKRLSPQSLLSVVPQCYLNSQSMDLNTGPVIKSNPELLDYVIVQYYNNPSCSYPFGFNFDTWKSIYTGPIVVGLAGNETSAITGGFLNPGMLQAVVSQVWNDPQFYGISVYDVSSANPPLGNYAEVLRNSLDGKIVGSGYAPQGPATDEKQWASRCGSTWTQANNTCSLIPCVPYGPCGSLQCFTFLAPCAGVAAIPVTAIPGNNTITAR